MLEFLSAPQNFPFTIALTVMLLISILEGIGAMFGAGISNVFNQLFPESDLDFDIEGPDLDSPGAMGKALSWLHIGRVPILVLLILFLITFGISGLIIQDFSITMFGYLLPALVASLAAFVVTVPVVKTLGSLLSRIIPKEESSAVSRKTFIGRVATLTLGSTKKGYPTRAKVKDRYGKVHYLMVEPDEEGDTFHQGEQVLLVKEDGVKFFAIKITSKEMEDIQNK